MYFHLSLLLLLTVGCGDSQAAVDNTWAGWPTTTQFSSVTTDPAALQVTTDSLLGVARVEVANGEYQPGGEPQHLIDGKVDNNLYHSRWGNGTVLPVTLDFTMAKASDIDYMVYYPRTEGVNGNVGKFDLYYYVASQPTAPIKAGTFDFHESSIPGMAPFASTIKDVVKVRLVVYSGTGGYVSGAEVQFCKRRRDTRLEKQLLEVFTDLTCSALRPDASAGRVNQLPPYFAHIAAHLHEGTYTDHEMKFRVQEYQPYSNPSVWAERLITRRYTLLDNPTGIYVHEGDEVVLLVGDTHGNPISVNNVGEQAMMSGTGFYLQTEPIGDSYLLHEGINKIKARKTGMLFIVYTTDLTSLNARPIKVHIPLRSGTVSGYWDLNTDKTNEQYARLIQQADYKYFPVKGNNIIFFFHRDKMMQAVPNDILSAIHLWDDIVGYQHELMGIEALRNNQFNNHMFAISPEGSYMWATDNYIGFVYTYLNNVLLRDNVMAQKDNAWGPAHEIGHVNQIAINWPGTTESSNNLFSNYTLYKLGKYCSRGGTIHDLAVARCVNHESWVRMGGATYQGENPELHMRMNWQLWNYFHRLGFKPDFFPTLFALLRQTRLSTVSTGEAQLRYAKMASKAANLDLSDFFERWGFFEPVDNFVLNQYGQYPYTVTQQQIDEAKSYMRQFDKPKHAFYYLEDRKYGDVGLDVDPGDVGHYTQFQANAQVKGTPTYTLSGTTVRVQNGQDAVAFEVVREGRVVYFFNTFTANIPSAIALDGATLQAVQADGKRVAMVRK